MSLYVVDVSVGVKWFIPEVATPDSLRLQTGGHELHVPAFFTVEFANILWKKIRRSEITRADDRLVNSLAGTAWAASIIRVQDVP